MTLEIFFGDLILIHGVQHAYYNNDLGLQIITHLYYLKRPKEEAIQNNTNAIKISIR